jgi:putative glutamine amidotransferase
VELALIEWARAAKKPILGICRGAQILNVAYGGTLYQDINEERPNLPGHHDTDWIALDQTLNIEPHSRLHSILGVASIGMNSKHHQAVKEIGRGLRASGKTDDGLIEAIESQDESFILGVQCHPESLWQRAEPKWKRLFEAFVAAACDRASHSKS